MGSWSMNEVYSLVTVSVLARWAEERSFLDRRPPEFFPSMEDSYAAREILARRVKPRPPEDTGRCAKARTTSRASFSNKAL